MYSTENYLELILPQRFPDVLSRAIAVPCQIHIHVRFERYVESFRTIKMATTERAMGSQQVPPLAMVRCGQRDYYVVI